MSLGPRRLLLSLLSLIVLGLPARAEHGVYDEAHLFSHDKRLQAEGTIDELRHITHKDLLIETLTSADFLSELSAEESKAYHDKKSEGEWARFFDGQALKRASRWQVNGVYVLLCVGSQKDEEPQRGFSRLFGKLKSLTQREVVGHAVVVWPPSDDRNLNDKYFPPEKQRELNRWLGDVKARDKEKAADKANAKDTEKAKEKNQDGVLEHTVAFVDDVLKTKARELNAPPAETFRWTHVLWAALALCGAWFVLGLLRGRVAARQEEAAGRVTGPIQPFAALYGTAGLLSLFEAWRTPAAPLDAPSPSPESDELAHDPMHPDDQDALARPPGFSPEEAPEAAP